MKKFIESKRDLPASPAPQVDIKKEIITFKDAVSLYSNRNLLLEKLANAELNAFYYKKDTKNWHLIYYKNFEVPLFSNSNHVELLILPWSFGIGQGYIDQKPFKTFNLLKDYPTPTEFARIHGKNEEPLLININKVILLRKELDTIIPNRKKRPNKPIKEIPAKSEQPNTKIDKVAAQEINSYRAINYRNRGRKTNLLTYLTKNS